MDYSNFLYLKEELSLIAVMVILLVYDLFAPAKGLKYFQPVACLLFLAHTLMNIFPAGMAEAFGGHVYMHSYGKHRKNNTKRRDSACLYAGKQLA